MYMKVKGNAFKNKCAAMEDPHQSKAEKTREKTFFDQFEPRSTRDNASG